MLDLEEALGSLGDKVSVGSLHATRPLSCSVRDKLWKLSSTNLELLSGLCMLTDSILVSVLLPYCRDGDSLVSVRHFSLKVFLGTEAQLGFSCCHFLPKPLGKPTASLGLRPCGRGTFSGILSECSLLTLYLLQSWYNYHG